MNVGSPDGCMGKPVNLSVAIDISVTAVEMAYTVLSFHDQTPLRLEVAPQDVYLAKCILQKLGIVPYLPLRVNQEFKEGGWMMYGADIDA